MQVEENLLGDSSDGVLRHLGEHGVAQLIEAGSGDTRSAVCGTGVTAVLGKQLQRMAAAKGVIRVVITKLY